MIRHSSPRLEFGALLILLVTLTTTIHQINAAPTVNHDTDLSTLEAESDGCYYNYNHYSEGDRIMTNEPCLNCTCHNQMLMCYLRVCPFTKPIGQDCVVEKREDQCCPIITCPEVPVELEGHAGSGSTALGHPDTYGCTIDNKFYTEGSQVPSSPHKPCELCYCIRNMTTCVMQECTLHVEGCQPVYHRGVCCPVRYECDHDSEGPLMLEDETTTTVRPTPGFMLTTTLSPSTDCVHDGQVIADGGLVETGKPCDHCYCMRGDIVCVVMECLEPSTMEGKNCTAVPPKADECCPQDYICDGDVVKAESFATTLAPTLTTVDKSEDDEQVAMTESSKTDKDEPSDTKPRLDTDETTAVPESASEKPDLHRKITKKPLEGELLATTLAPEDEESKMTTKKSDMDEQTSEPEDDDKMTTALPAIDRTDKPLDEVEPQVTLSSDDLSKPEVSTDAVKAAETTDAPKAGDAEDEKSTDAPKAGASTDAPKDAETTDAPKSVETTDASKDGKTTDAPKAGDVEGEKTTDAPKAGEPTDAPKAGDSEDEKSTDAPKAEVSTDAPKVDQSTDTPKDQKSTEGPTDEASTDAPKAEDSTAISDSEKSTEAPKTGESTDAPEKSTDAPKIEKATDAPKDVESTDAPKDDKSTEAPKTSDESKEEDDLQKTTIAPEDRLSTFFPDMDKTTQKPDSEDVSMDMNTVMPDVPSEDDVVKEVDLDRTTSKPELDITTMRLPEDLTQKPLAGAVEDSSKTTIAPEKDQTRETTIKPRFEDEEGKKEEDEQKLESLLPATTMMPELAERTTLGEDDMKEDGKATTVTPMSDDKEKDEVTTLKTKGVQEDESKLDDKADQETDDQKTEAPVDLPTTVKYGQDDESMNEISETMEDAMKDKVTTAKPPSEEDVHTVIPDEDAELQKHIDEEDEKKDTMPQTTVSPISQETHKPEFDRGNLGEGEHVTVRPEDKLSTFIPDLAEKTTTKPDSGRDDLELPPAQIFTELPDMSEMTTMKLPEDEIIEPSKPVESDSHMMMGEEDVSKAKPTEEEPLEMNTVIPETPADKDAEQQTVGLDDAILTTTLTPLGDKDGDLLSSIDKILESLPPAKTDKYPEMDLPQAIPGEGDCLFDGKHFRHNTTVPSTERCIICVCLNSAVRCNQTCDDLPSETTDKSEEAIVESSEVPAVVVEMKEPQSEEEVTAIVKEMHPTTLSPIESEDQTTMPGDKEDQEQVTVDLGLKVDVPEEASTDKPSETATKPVDSDKPTDTPKSDETSTDAPVAQAEDKMTEKPSDATTVSSDMDLHTARPEDEPKAEEPSTDKALVDDKEEEKSTDVPMTATEKTETKEPESTKSSVEEEKGTTDKLPETPDDETVSTDLPSTKDQEKATERPTVEEKTTLTPELSELPKKDVDETTISIHEEKDKSTVAPPVLGDRVDIQEGDQKTESPLDSTTLAASEQTTLHEIPQEEVQTHAPPAIESLEKKTDSPLEKTTLAPEQEKMTDRPEDAKKEEEISATTVSKDESDKMTESPVEKTTLAGEKEKPLTDEIEKQTEKPEKESTTIMSEKDDATTLATLEKDDDVKADKDKSEGKDQTTFRPLTELDEKVTEQPKLEQTTLKSEEKPEEQDMQTTLRPTMDMEDKLVSITETPEEKDATMKPETDEMEKGATVLPLEGEKTQEKEEMKPEGTDAPKSDVTMKPDVDELEKATTMLPSDVETTDKTGDMKPEGTELPKDEVTMKPESPELEKATTVSPSEDEKTPKGTDAPKSDVTVKPELDEKATTVLPSDSDTTDKAPEMKPEGTEAPKADQATTLRPDADDLVKDEEKLESAKPTEAPSDSSTEKDVAAHETTMKSKEEELETAVTTEQPSEGDDEEGFTTTKITLAPAKGHKKPVTEMIDGTMVEIVTPSSEIKTEAPGVPYEIVTPLSVEQDDVTTLSPSIDTEEKGKTTLKPAGDDLKKDEAEETTEMFDKEKLTTVSPISSEVLDKDTTDKPDEDEKVQDKLTTLRPDSMEQTDMPMHEDDLMDKQTVKPEDQTKDGQDATTLTPLSSESAKDDEEGKATTAQPTEDHTEAHKDDKDDDEKLMAVTPSKDVEVGATDAPKKETVPESTESPKEGATDKPKQDDDKETMTEKPLTETTEQPKLPASEEIETKTELPYGQVTERLPEELTTILAQSGLDLTTMRIEYDHTMAPGKDTQITEAPTVTDAPKYDTDERTDVSTDVPSDKEEKVTEGSKLPSEDKEEGTTLSSKPEMDGEKLTTVAPTHEENATEKDTVKTKEPEATTVKADDDVSKTTLAPEHEDTMRPHVDATTVKADDESKEEMPEKTTTSPMQEVVGLDKTTSQPTGIDTKFGEESDKDEERDDELPTATTSHPGSHEEDSHEEDVQRPVDTSEPHYPSYPEEHTAKPPQPTYGTPAAPGFDPATFGQMPSGGYPSSPDNYDDYEDNESDPSLFGPGTCRYGGKLYVSAQQIPRDDPCDFCFCFRSDIICLQQSCPPPINGCHEETIDGFCCPRYECPVSMATVVNITTSTTTTTTTLPPHFNRHAYKGATRAGCFIDGRTYQVGDVIERNTGPCMQCKCGADAQMECLPLNCSPEPMLRQMMEQHLMSSRRRR